MTVIHDSEGSNDYRSDPISRVLADGLDEAVANHLGNPVADRQWLATTASTLAAAVRAELIQGVPRPSHHRGLAVPHGRWSAQIPDSPQ